MTSTRPWMAAVVAAFLVTAPSASAQKFSTATPLAITQAASASPYPSTIDVAGMNGEITGVKVTLIGITLSATQLDVVLVSPHGEAVLFTSDVPSTVTSKWTFDDAAAELQPADAPSGTYKPTDLDLVPMDSDTLPEPAPAEYDTTLSALNGHSPNGQWKLYVADSTDSGLHPSLGQFTGWALDITTNFVPAPAIAIDPPAIDFGAVTRGPLAPRFITITNTGTGILEYQLPGFFSPDFGMTIQNIQPPDIPCGLPLAPGESCKDQVMFTPVTAGLKTATLTITSNAPGSPHSIPLTGTLLESLPVTQQPPADTGDPLTTLQRVLFQAPPALGQPATLHVEASNDKAPVTGVRVDFGESQGLYAASACSAGMKPRDGVFDIPYTFLKPGLHWVNVTVFAGGCGKATARSTTFSVDIQPPKAARRHASGAATIAGPNITSRCKNASILPTKAKAKLIVKALLCVINEQRKAAKLRPLRLSKTLGKAANAHTKAMIAGRFFAHQGPKEAALAARLKKAKYRGGAAENIGAGGGILGSPMWMVNGWMHSTLHRANLLSKKWRTVGVGFLAQYPVPTGSKPVATFTADFGVR